MSWCTPKPHGAGCFAKLSRYKLNAVAVLEAYVKHLDSLVIHLLHYSDNNGRMLHLYSFPPAPGYNTSEDQLIKL